MKSFELGYCSKLLIDAQVVGPSCTVSKTWIKRKIVINSSGRLERWFAKGSIPDWSIRVRVRDRLRRRLKILRWSEGIAKGWITRPEEDVPGSHFGMKVKFSLPHARSPACFHGSSGWFYQILPDFSLWLSDWVENNLALAWPARLSLRGRLKWGCERYPDFEKERGREGELKSAVSAKVYFERGRWTLKLISAFRVSELTWGDIYVAYWREICKCQDHGWEIDEITSLHF